MIFFEKFPEIVAVMSRKNDGNMRIHGGNINDNRRTFLERNGIEISKVYSALLTHSASVEVISSGSPFLLPDIDALVTNQLGIFLSVTVADCYPVLFYDNKNKIMGIAHAGWKGLMKGIIPNVISKMKKLGAEAENISVAIGPGIRQCHFEFEKEKAEEIFKLYYNDKFIRIEEGKKVYIDLLGIIVDQLNDLGIEKKKMEISGECTFCEDEKYLSSRRDKRNPIEAMMMVVGMK